MKSLKWRRESERVRERVRTGGERVRKSERESENWRREAKGFEFSR